MSLSAGFGDPTLFQGRHTTGHPESLCRAFYRYRNSKLAHILAKHQLAEQPHVYISKLIEHTYMCQFFATSCPVPNCSSTRQIIFHWDCCELGVLCDLDITCPGARRVAEAREAAVAKRETEEGGSARTGGGKASPGGRPSTAGGGSASHVGGTVTAGGGIDAAGGGTSAAGGRKASAGGGKASAGGGIAAAGGGVAAAGGGTSSAGGRPTTAAGGKASPGGGIAAAGGGASSAGGGTGRAGGGIVTAGGEVTRPEVAAGEGSSSTTRAAYGVPGAEYVHPAPLSKEWKFRQLDLVITTLSSVVPGKTEYHDKRFQLFWDHIRTCKWFAKKCPIPYCTTTRLILFHWGYCNDIQKGCCLCRALLEAVFRRKKVDDSVLPKCAFFISEYLNLRYRLTALNEFFDDPGNLVPPQPPPPPPLPPQLLHAGPSSPPPRKSAPRAQRIWVTKHQNRPEAKNRIPPGAIRGPGFRIPNERPISTTVVQVSDDEEENED